MIGRKAPTLTFDQAAQSHWSCQGNDSGPRMSLRGRSIRQPRSPRNVEDLLFERGIDICHETVRLGWKLFGPMFAAEIRRKRDAGGRQVSGPVGLIGAIVSMS